MSPVTYPLKFSRKSIGRMTNGTMQTLSMVIPASTRQEKLRSPVVFHYFVSQLYSSSSGNNPCYAMKSDIPKMVESVRKLNMIVTNRKHTLALSRGSASAMMRLIISRKIQIQTNICVNMPQLYSSANALFLPSKAVTKTWLKKTQMAANIAPTMKNWKTNSVVV